MTRVVIDSLHKTYDGLSALDGASLEARPGERLVVLGPSGSGKTALARVVAGLDAPDSGDILFDGQSVREIPPHQRHVGYLPADGGLWPHRTVSQNVGYALRIKGIGRRERRSRVAEALGAARIDSLGDRLPGSLAPLQARRAALARSLIAEPRLLLLDEPTAGLDARSRLEFRDDLRRVQDEGPTTALLLTSDPREALALADRLAVMDFGKILQVGPPDEVYNRPADSFVAQLLGPINLIQGQAETSDSRGNVVVRTPLGRLVGRTQREEAPEPGSPVTVAIRPEAIGLGGPVPPDANRFPASVERLTLQGATRQVALRGPGDWPVSALALQAPSDGLREGQSLMATVASEFVVVLPSRASRDEASRPTILPIAPEGEAAARP